MSTTREDILAAASGILNAKGLSALSIRAVADLLELSPGNVSYYFPRKERLVAALVERVGDDNRDRLAVGVTSLAGFLEWFRVLFEAQHQYRGLLLALPDIVETYGDIRARYLESERARRSHLLEMLIGLREPGSLNAPDHELARVVSHLTLIGRFWIAEAMVSFRDLELEHVYRHYLALIADTLHPHASAAGRAELRPYLEGWIDAGGDLDYDHRRDSESRSPRPDHPSRRVRDLAD